MKFDSVFPNAVAGFEVPPPGALQGLYKDTNLHYCFRCGEATYWFDLLSEGLPVCSAECHGRFWTEFWEAERKAGPINV